MALLVEPSRRSQETELGAVSETVEGVSPSAAENHAALSGREFQRDACRRLGETVFERAGGEMVMRVDLPSGVNLAVWKRAAPRNRMRETFTSGSVGGLVGNN